MNRLVAKATLFVAQSSTILGLLGYLVFRSQLVIVPFALAIGTLFHSRCSNCETSFQNPKIYSQMKLLRFYDTRLIDDCPVCHKAMYANGESSPGVSFSIPKAHWPVLVIVFDVSPDWSLI